MANEGTCPVCGAVVQTGRQPLLFLGKRWYFCGQPCRVAFKREPERWAKARPEAGVGVEAGGAPMRTRGASPFKVR